MMAQNKTSLRVLFAAYILVLVGFCAIFYKTLFEWPAGIVIGNLLASAIWAPLAVIHLDQLSRRHHREHMDLLRRHHREQLDAINAIGSPPDARPGLADRGKGPASEHRTMSRPGHEIILSG
jgi:hypothetical protein